MDDPCGTCAHRRGRHWETNDGQTEGCAEITDYMLCDCEGFKPLTDSLWRKCQTCTRVFMPALCALCHGTLCFTCCLARRGGS